MTDHAGKSTNAVYAVRAKHQGEALAHCITRAAFLRYIVADSRTLDLFAFWREQTGVGPVIDDMTALLDAAARRAGFAHRSELRRQENAFHLIPILGFLQQHEEHYERLLAETQEARARFAIGWVVAELYGAVVDEQVPIRAWLASDLLTIFRWDVSGRVYGERVSLMVPRSPTVDAVEKGQRPQGEGEVQERNAGWYYRLHVQPPPRATPTQIAEELDAASTWRHAPKDYRPSVRDRVDTKLVRRSSDEAKRLLELPVPPEQWSQYIKIHA